MREVVKKEDLKLLHAGIIYPVSHSEWVSPIQVVPKKGGMTVVINEKNELIPQTTVIGWRMCIDYQKLNTLTNKDHFPSLMKCWSGWRITLSFVSLMGIQVITRYQFIQMTKAKPPLHAVDGS